MIEKHGAGAPLQTLAGSHAFREASLRSEQRRAYALIGVLALVIGLVLLRRASLDLPASLLLTALAGVGLLVVVQVATLLIVHWARRRQRGVPCWFEVLTLVMENLVPTGMLFGQLMIGGLPPHTSLFSPPILAYGLLISLTTLRLRPAYCVLAGAIGAGGYSAAAAYVHYGLGIAEPTTGLPRVAYINSALLIFISGLAAAWVAHEIRTHMSAALREAETRREVERLEQDLSVARSIQRALLPSAAPSIPGFDIAGWNRPADQTGGDYYDWQQLPDGHWIVTLADVSGHGIGPALVTAACRAYVRASGTHHRDLAALTSHVNHLLSEDLPEGRFVTMVSALIDAQGGPLALLSAGHGPIVLYVGTTGAVQDILPRDLPLAIEPDAKFGPAQPVTMAPGDVLALVTDGFAEWARLDGDGRREEFGMTRLRESLRRHAQRPAAAMIEAITADVAAFAGSTPQQDDLTMVIIRRVG